MTAIQDQTNQLVQQRLASVDTVIRESIERSINAQVIMCKLCTDTSTWILSIILVHVHVQYLVITFNEIVYFNNQCTF